MARSLYYVREQTPAGCVRERIAEPVSEERERHREYWRIHSEPGEEIPADPPDDELLASWLLSRKDDEDTLEVRPATRDEVKRIRGY